MTKLYNKLKKPCFWPILGQFSQFLGQKKFSWKIWLSQTTSNGSHTTSNTQLDKKGKKKKKTGMAVAKLFVLNANAIMP